MDDKDIVDLYWKRDESAITQTERQYGPYCFSIAYNILRNREDAEESVNDTYMNAWNSMPPHRPAVLSTFLGKITRFISLKKWRDMRAKKRGGGEVALAYEELSDCIPGGYDIDSELEAKEIGVIINKFLEALPKTERRIFVCRYWYFDSISSISAQFDFSESKVKSMLFRTRSKLMTKLKNSGNW